MKKNNVRIELYRNRTKEMELCGCLGNAQNGIFEVPFKGRLFTVLASDGGGWDHVSVSLPDRCPTWDEMCYFKNLFFETCEWVLQYHPASTRYVNIHSFCLHLWSPQKERVPIPPQEYV